MADLPEMPALTDEQIDALSDRLWPDGGTLSDRFALRSVFPHAAPPRPEDWRGGDAWVYWSEADGWDMGCYPCATPEVLREFARRVALAVEWSEQHDPNEETT